MSISSVLGLFRQVGQDFERSHGGLGIDLSLVRQRVELHGTSASTQSADEAGGSTFSIRLALLDVPDAPAPGSKSPRPISKATSLRILIADDNRDAAEILWFMLEVSGHSTELTQDGHTALKLARDLRPDVVVLDIGMPGMNGYEADSTLYAAKKADRNCVRYQPAGELTPAFDTNPVGRIGEP